MFFSCSVFRWIRKKQENLIYWQKCGNIIGQARADYSGSKQRQSKLCNGAEGSVVELKKG